MKVDCCSKSSCWRLIFVEAVKDVGDDEECCFHGVLRAESMLVCGWLDVDEVLHKPFE